MGLREALGGRLFTRDRRSPEEKRFGTGLWRQHRDRFSRSVDRYFETAEALHREFGDVDGTAVQDVGAGAPVTPVAAAVGEISALTATLNALDDRVAELMARCHRTVPLDGLVFPAEGRKLLGDVPEAVSRAASLVAQAAQTAAMLRAHLRMHGAADAAQLLEYPASARRYADRAAELLQAASATADGNGAARGERP
ncbi:hypothetical protein [Brevibacterium salitolerans]|uniref:Uncharacterized protein n=1 Tax=Brevibacterium salitolerans TaxID=1403566 RepID=A0ABN2WHM4_9MICO